MKISVNVRQSVWMVMAGLGFWMTACTKDPSVTPQSPVSGTPAKADQSVNNWILENMRAVYYWNDKMPANPDTMLAVAPFFYSLLYDYNNRANPERDRFSWIQESAADLKASLSGEQKTTGLEVKYFLRSAGSTEVVIKVLYVLPGSPAYKAGLKRGDIITTINGQKLTTGNYASLTNNPTTFNYGLAKLESDKIVDTEVVKTVTAEVFQQNPVFLDSIYAIGGKTIGYLVYNQFIPGPNGSTTPTYDQKLEQIFSKFKARGVNELVLDLRYNPGGYVSSSVKLASMIAKGVDNTKTFYRTEYNKDVMAELQSQNQTAQLTTRFQTKAQNIGGNLSRVFVLTTGGTASASELIINGLRPFMPVITIGETTYGKNVGSITISDKTGKIKWGMQPIVFKSFNAQNQSDYSTGFTPTIIKNEPLALKPLGDLEEEYLNAAVAQIVGNGTARISADQGPQLPAIGSSVERRAGGSNMFDDRNPLNW
ncbi:S41 family peptidase [Larkinella punicea]|uniref:PDZ domain-containing protein n=1 Tax=Larkinella punicea TaxID=2315727 RepID=A0A368JK07_9BACT|nr:S41 family peptidase [Larkinella punicea]RCR67997.1 PDZ domain-containing protein [Larkinella punicea]